MKNTAIIQGFIAVLLIYSLPFYADAQTVKSANDTTVSFPKKMRDSLSDTFNRFRKILQAPTAPTFYPAGNTPPYWIDTGGRSAAIPGGPTAHKMGERSGSSGSFENTNPILYYLHKATEESIAEIKRTKVKCGAVLG